MSSPRAIIIGAGVSGLACARVLRDAGRAPVILERARGVGGRCATSRLEGQPVDLGPAFLHGKDRDFLAALEASADGLISGWPLEIRGSGRPCQPEAFSPGERRLALADGLTTFPKSLASGLTIQTGVCVTGLRASGGAVKVLLEEGDALSAELVVLAVAPEQALPLLETHAPGPLATLRALLEMSHSEASLVLAALYPTTVPLPDWQVSYPEDSRVLQLISHDSTKRIAPKYRALVFQAHARWSAEHLEDPAWEEALLSEAARILGTWASTPLHRHAHRWRFARTGRSGELAAPMLFSLEGGARLGICGDRFARGGGVEAAWQSGRALAGKILSLEKT